MTNEKCGLKGNKIRVSYYSRRNYDFGSGLILREALSNRKLKQIPSYLNYKGREYGTMYVGEGQGAVFPCLYQTEIGSLKPSMLLWTFTSNELNNKPLPIMQYFIKSLTFTYSFFSLIVRVYYSSGSHLPGHNDFKYTNNVKFKYRLLRVWSVEKSDKLAFEYLALRDVQSEDAGLYTCHVYYGDEFEEHRFVTTLKTIEMKKFRSKSNKEDDSPDYIFFEQMPSSRTAAAQIFNSYCLNVVAFLSDNSKVLDKNISCFRFDDWISFSENKVYKRSYHLQLQMLVRDRDNSAEKIFVNNIIGGPGVTRHDDSITPFGDGSLYGYNTFKSLSNLKITLSAFYTF
ncbi:hypothetical protein B4U79_16945 [Dinothrombium tinctorium]|uniref:Ig-like domain-containing protein n=1 Tax=Dinothrombium tinctorium TaxID=1965070 RepID=A0A3S3NWB1_9ACAR|nr:hypothetical protein B4U79_16945 [Dinothrombium tinctorium]